MVIWGARMKKTLLLILLLIAIPASAKITFRMDFDDFPTWSPTNENSQWGDSRCQYVYNCWVTDGPLGLWGKVLKTDFRDADCVASNWELNRTELYEKYHQTCFDNCDIWWGYRGFFNENTFNDGGVNQGRTVIMQYHTRTDPGETSRSPAFGVQYYEGELQIQARACIDQPMPNGQSCSGGWDYNVIETITVPVMNEWNDIVVQAHYTYSNPDGFINVWVNGNLEYQSSGHYLGYHDYTNPGYFKTGQYNWTCDFGTPIREYFIDDIAYCYSKNGDAEECDICDVLPTAAHVPSGYSCP